MMCRRTMKGEPTGIHGSDVLTAKHGAKTDWMKANGESLSSLEEGDIVHVLDYDHASTSISKEYKVTTVPSMEYDFQNPYITIVEVGTLGPGITIEPGKVSKDAQR